MNSGKTLSLFQQYFHLNKSTNGWWRFTNPWDLKAQQKRDNTMAYNPALGWVKDFRTGYSKHVAGFLMEYLNSDYREVKSAVEQQNEIRVELVSRPSKRVVKMPEGFNSIAFGEGIFGNRARQYLQRRGFDIDILDMYGFGYCDKGEYFGYIIIPYKSNGSIVYWSARDFIGQSPKYKNPKLADFGVSMSTLLFNEDALNIFNRVYIVEGAFDALTIGSNAIATSGWSISTRQMNKIIKSAANELVFISDSGFRKKIISEATPLIRHKSVSVVEPDLEGNDVNEWGWENVKPFLKNLKTLTYADIFKA